MDSSIWVQLAVPLTTLLARGLMLAVVALLVLLAMRAFRASAATQNYFLRLTCVALLALPALWFVPPVWQKGGEDEEVILGALEPTGGAPVFIDTPIAQMPESAPVSPVVAEVPKTFLEMWAAPLLLLWSAGCLIVLLRLATGLWRARILRRACVAVDAPHWLDSLSRVKSELGIASGVTLRSGAAVKVPFVMGLIRHTLLLPATVIDSTSETERMLILRHELAHVKRRDALSRFLAQLALALHALNPAAWLLLRAARLTEECSIDDAVLQNGTAAVDYAELLSRFAKGGFREITCPAMAQPSTIGKRVQRILDPSLNRRTPGRTARATLALSVCTACIALASVWAQEPGAKDTDPEWLTVPFRVDREKWLAAVTIDGKELTAKEFLERSGFDLHLDEGGTALYFYGQIAVRLKSQDLSQYQEFFGKFAPPDTSLKILLETRHVYTRELADQAFDADIPAEGRETIRGIFTADQLKEMLDVLAKQSATRIIPTPTYVTMSGQRASIEASQPGFPVCEIDPVANDDGSKINMDVTFREGDNEKLQSTSVTIWSGTTIAYELDSSTDERHLVFITAAVIRPSGAMVNMTPPFPDHAKLDIKTVVLDPGHGGDDSKGGGNGLVEKDFNLDLARRTRIALEEKGFNVVLIRSKDEFVSLRDRAELGNKVDNAVFVGLHANLSSDTEERGFETWYPKGDDSDDQRAFSRQLAVEVQKALANEIGNESTDRGIRDGGYYVLQHSIHPAILVETGFMSNAQDAELLKSDAYRDRIAKAIATAVEKFADSVSK
ncbi:MAG: N-acetylmuramoyl-L-alanine amidase [Verrucomicrobiae bacterium]|nr:N-acetylmuramoyl-L-alanine amidase [Verrucomicrobiae bacterium]